MFDHLYFSAISREDINILLRNFGVDQASKAQAMVSTNLRQAYSGISGTTFHNEGVGIDLTGLQRPLYDGDAGTILGTAPWIQTFQLGETIKV
jgi:hypothetical protein